MSSVERPMPTPRTAEQAREVFEAFARVTLKHAAEYGFDCAFSLRQESTDEGATLHVFSTTTVENTECLLVAALLQISATEPRSLDERRKDLQ